MSTLTLPEWPYVYGAPSATGKIRSKPEDFSVTEQLAFEPSGVGEHVFLYIQKIDENTEYVARQLAKFANVRQRDVGFAGLKDRHAVTSQWFSIWLPGLQPEPDWQTLASDHLKIIKCVRHARKLRRGVLAGNHFNIVIRDWSGDPETTTWQLQQIKTNGLANYYGEQRFGRAGQNINKALAMFQGARVGREQRSLYLSAARSYLFNQLLARRVEDKTWNQALSGDVFQFDRSHSCFKSTQPDAEIYRRVASAEIHPTAVLYGKGEADVAADALALEQFIVEAHPELATGLVAAGVARDRRALRTMVPDLSWQFLDQHTLALNFSLSAGNYATALLREIIKLTENPPQ